MAIQNRRARYQIRDTDDGSRKYTNSYDSSQEGCLPRVRTGWRIHVQTPWWMWVNCMSLKQEKEFSIKFFFYHYIILQRLKPKFIGFYCFRISLFEYLFLINFWNRTNRCQTTGRRKTSVGTDANTEKLVISLNFFGENSYNLRNFIN